MAVDRLALDPTIAALADFSASLGPVPIVRTYIVAPGKVAFAMPPAMIQGAALMFLTMMAMVVTRLAAQPTEASARSTRHLAYSMGLVKPPRRRTAADRRADDVRAWGFTKRVHPDLSILDTLASNPLVGSIQIVGANS